MPITPDSTGLARVLSLLLADHERGELPVEIIERFQAYPWTLLRGLEVHETPFQRIPQSVNPALVRMTTDLNGDGVVMGVGKNRKFWSSALHVPRNYELNMDDPFVSPFITVDGELTYFVRYNGWVHDIVDGRFVAHRVLNRNPLILWDSKQRLIEADGSRHHVAQHNKIDDPAGAILASGEICLWDSFGNGYMFDGGYFAVPSGYSVHSAAQAGNVIRSTFAVVFRCAAKTPIFRIMVYRDGQYVMETTKDHASISTPVIRSDGTVFARFEGELMRLGPKATSFEKIEDVVGAVTGDPWLGGDDIVFATTTDGTLRIWPDDHCSVTVHRETLFAEWPYIGIRYEREGVTGIEILRFDDDGGIGLRHPYGEVSAEGFEFLMTLEGYRLSLRLLGDGVRRIVHDVDEGDDTSPRCTMLEVTGKDGDVFDLRQVVTKGTRIFAVRQQRSEKTKKWSVVMNNQHNEVMQLGEPSDAIFCLHIDGPCLRWYRLDGGMITDCRLHLGS